MELSPITLGGVKSSISVRSEASVTLDWDWKVIEQELAVQFRDAAKGVLGATFSIEPLKKAVTRLFLYTNRVERVVLAHAQVIVSGKNDRSGSVRMRELRPDKSSFILMVWVHPRLRYELTLVLRPSCVLSQVTSELQDAIAKLQPAAEESKNAHSQESLRHGAQVAVITNALATVEKELSPEDKALLGIYSLLRAAKQQKGSMSREQAIYVLSYVRPVVAPSRPKLEALLTKLEKAGFLESRARVHKPDRYVVTVSETGFNRLRQLGVDTGPLKRFRAPS